MIHYKKFKKYIPNCYTTEKGRLSVYKKKAEISDIFTFDIETTSFFLIDGKLTAWDEQYTNEQYLVNPCGGLCYIWQFSINDTVYYGRDLEEFPKFLSKVFEDVDFTIVNKPVVWVHNLSFEFQWLREYLNFSNVFSRTMRKPMKAECEYCLFRCSYFLTNLRLEKWAESTPVIKKTGQLDYNVLRTPLTELTPEQMEYCEYDCLVVYYGIKDFVRKYGKLHKIPMTATGETRYVLRNMYKDDIRYKKKMASLVPYEQLQRLETAIFAGGSTGCNIRYTDINIYDLMDSYDEKSAYPAMMIKYRYPYSKFTRTIKVKRFEDMDTRNKAYLLVVRFKGIKRKESISYLSKSKLLTIKNGTFDNGKLIQADECIYYCTSIDIDTVNMVYTYEDYEILTCYVSYLMYLDSTFVDYILTLFYNKTCLEGIDDELYMASKGQLNAQYGVQVTKIISDNVLYKENKWQLDPLTSKEIQEKLQKMRDGYNQITAYQVGIFITAYNRRALYTALMRVEQTTKKLVYWDTDSTKAIRDPRIDKIFDDLNAENVALMDAAMDYHGFDRERTRPKNKKGKVCQLGCWEKETAAHPYVEFKCLGAKRYIYKYEGDEHYNITVAGVPKKNAILMHSLDDFNQNTVFPSNARDEKGMLISKNMHLYKDGNNLQVTFPDGYRNTNINATVLRPASYDLTLAPEYRALIQFIKNGGV